MAVVPNIRQDPLYDEPVNIDMEPEEALRIVLQVEPPESEDSD